MQQTHKKLFSSVQVGAITLKHRVVMPALSRLRAEWPSGIPSDLNLEYYSQRASDGGLILIEATAISALARGYRGAPGIYSDEQVAGWKRIDPRFDDVQIGELEVVEPLCDVPETRQPS
jgi:N-ethylmaleimide reductase